MRITVEIEMREGATRLQRKQIAESITKAVDEALFPLTAAKNWNCSVQTVEMEEEG